MQYGTTTTAERWVLIKSRYRTKCCICFEPIAKGTLCAWTKARGVKCDLC